MKRRSRFGIGQGLLTYTIWEYDGNGPYGSFPTLEEAKSVMQTRHDPCFVEDANGNTVADWDGIPGLRAADSPEGLL